MPFEKKTEQHFFWISLIIAGAYLVSKSCDCSKRYDSIRHVPLNELCAEIARRL